jgi:hypothetical protein
MVVMNMKSIKTKERRFISDNDRILLMNHFEDPLKPNGALKSIYDKIMSSSNVEGSDFIYYTNDARLLNA